jgi:acetyl esterase/lipase
MRTAKGVLVILLGILISAISCAAQSKPSEHQLNFVSEPQTFPLWEHGAPGALGNEDRDIPTLTIYLPLDPTRSRTAVLIAPGGSYKMLASNHEGRQVANWFNALGVTAFVLKYRLGPRYHNPIEFQDAQRAMRLVRSRAKEFGYDLDRVGMMGFSAGGHLASTVGTHFDAGNASAPDPIDRMSCRPDFLILAYPVISMSAPFRHEESATELLGENASPELRKELSSELHVTAQTPPTFLLSTSEDTLVPPENTVAFYLALRKAGVPAEMHIFEKGPHGVGLDLGDPVLGMWPTLLANWLRERGLLRR